MSYNEQHKEVHEMIYGEVKIRNLVQEDKAKGVRFTIPDQESLRVPMPMVKGPHDILAEEAAKLLRKQDEKTELLKSDGNQTVRDGSGAVRDQVSGGESPAKGTSDGADGRRFSL